MQAVASLGERTYEPKHVQGHLQCNGVLKAFFLLRILGLASLNKIVGAVSQKHMHRALVCLAKCHELQSSTSYYMSSPQKPPPEEGFTSGRR